VIIKIRIDVSDVSLGCGMSDASRGVEHRIGDMRGLNTGEQDSLFIVMLLYL
jgi:hypothetical protein